MNNIQTPVSLSFDNLLASLLENKESLANELSDKNNFHTENIDSFGSWYEADWVINAKVIAQWRITGSI